jgi:glycosyltransferase involved in cell wall biosynthesis
MKIAHLDTGRTWRGGQGQALLLARGLAARGHDNLLLAPPGPLLERASAAGIETVPWSSHGELDLIALLAAERTLARRRPEVVHCHGAHAHALGVPAARLARVPAVVVSRRVDFAVGWNPASVLKYRMPVDRYLCISRGVIEVMRQGGVPAERLALVPSGVELPAAEELDREARDAPDLRSLLGLPESAPIVGTVAALAPHKNHADLLLAAKDVVRERTDTHFVWIGEGECRPALLERRAELGLDSHVHLLGFRPDARALMRQFTVFALSSYLEGLCTSLLDAQIRGVPIVATRVGGIPEVVDDGVGGRLVPGRDPTALAQALLGALGDPAARAAWAAHSARSVRHFSADRMVDRTLAEYVAVLRGRDSGEREAAAVGRRTV